MTFFNLHREHIDGFLSPSLTSTQLHCLRQHRSEYVTVTDTLQPILSGLSPQSMNNLHEAKEGVRLPSCGAEAFVGGTRLH